MVVVVIVVGAHSLEGIDDHVHVVRVDQLPAEQHTRLDSGATEVCHLYEASGLIAREREVTAHGLDEPQPVFVVAHVLGGGAIGRLVGWLGVWVVRWLGVWVVGCVGGSANAAAAVVVLEGPRSHLESGNRVLELIVIAYRVRACWY